MWKLAAILMVATLILGCQNGGQREPLSSNGQNRSFGTGNWDQLGIDHNRGLAYIDYRMATAGWDTTWGETYTRYYMENCISEFVIDSTTYDKDSTDLGRTAVGNATFSYENMESAVEVLRSNSLITEREASFLYRLVALVTIADEDEMDSTTFADSLEAYEQDILTVSWQEDETWCLAISSVAIYSWEFQITGGWTFYQNFLLTAPGQREHNVSLDLYGRYIVRILAHDLFGAIVGGTFGGLPGAAAGAIGASGAAMLDDMFNGM